MLSFPSQSSHHPAASTSNPMQHPTSAASPVKQFLSAFTVDELPPFFIYGRSKAITVPTSASLPEVLKTLIDNHILAAPVVDGTGRAVSVVSIMDLMNHFLNNFLEENLKRETKHTYDFFALVIAQKMMANESAAGVQELGSLDPAVILSDESTLYDAVVAMVTTRAHRVLITDKGMHLRSVLTQSRVLQLLGMLVDQIPECGKRVEQLGLVKPVFTVKETDSSLSAFKLMREKRVSAVGVVDGNGKLVGNVSASDIKAIGYDMSFFELLGVSVKQYMETVLKSHSRNNFLAAAGVVKCKPTATLGEVVRLVNFYGVHRVYVTNDAEAPIGIVSLTDILTQLVQEQAQ